MTELRKHMGLFSTTMYGVGLILGAGIYVLIGEATGMAGNSVWLAFVLGALVAIFSGLSYAELSSLFPKAAAEYVFVKNAFKSNFLAFVIGWLTFFTSVISASTVAVGFGGYVTEFVDFPIVLSASILIIVLSFVNFIGIRESSWMNIVFTSVEAFGLTLIIFIGFTFSGANMDLNYLEMPYGINGVFLAFVLIFFAFIGFEDMVNIAEETKEPRKILPKAIIFSIIITASIYILVAFSAVRIVDWQELGSSVAPLADVAGKVFGVNGKVFLSFIALFATTNTVLIILLAGSRMLYGMAKQQSMPKMFSKIHNTTRTPWTAVIAIMVFSLVFIYVGNITTIANITVFAVVITFALVNLSVIILRYKKPKMERPFKVPISIGKFPLLPAFGLFSAGFMMTQFDFYVFLIGIGTIGVAILFYYFYQRHLKTA